jgi:hypothetical protein
MLQRGIKSSAEKAAEQLGLMTPLVDALAIAD